MVKMDAMIAGGTAHYLKRYAELLNTYAERGIILPDYKDKANIEELADRLYNAAEEACKLEEYV